MWQALAQLVSAAGFEPVVTWGDEGERKRAQNIADLGGATVQARTPLSALAWQLAHSAAVIGVDSGLAHLAAALGTPTLGLYGPTDGVLTGCRGARAQVLQSKFACSPCLNSVCRYRGEPQLWQDTVIEPACFAQQTPAAVWQAAQRLMGAS